MPIPINLFALCCLCRDFIACRDDVNKIEMGGFPAMKYEWKKNQFECYKTLKLRLEWVSSVLLNVNFFKLLEWSEACHSIMDDDNFNDDLALELYKVICLGIY